MIEFFFTVAFVSKMLIAFPKNLCWVIFSIFKISNPQLLYRHILLLFLILAFIHQNSKMMTFQVWIIKQF
ncbi:MAG TPA: hypothetical protein DGF66_04520 [Lachnoclostridium sp.]|nr:hypothetical protein [Lachnoclostridium sp.]